MVTVFHLVPRLRTLGAFTMYVIKLCLISHRDVQTISTSRVLTSALTFTCLVIKAQENVTCPVSLVYGQENACYMWEIVLFILMAEYYKSEICGTEAREVENLAPEFFLFLWRVNLCSSGPWHCKHIRQKPRKMVQQFRSGMIWGRCQMRVKTWRLTSLIFCMILLWPSPGNCRGST